MSRTIRCNLFGRADLATVYRRAKDLIVEHRLLRLAQYTEIDGIRRLTICNLWRIERSPDDSIKTLEFCLRAAEWKEVDTEALKHWPQVPFYPVRETRSLDWWRSIIRKVIWKALYAVGYDDLPTHLTEYSAATADMSRGRMAGILIASYLGKEEQRGRLDPKSMCAGARALRAAFCQHILDSAVLSALLVIDYSNVKFPRYLCYARSRAGLLKVATEHRNLLPLLPSINPEHWGRDDLFSRRLWIKGRRKSTALDRRPIRHHYGDGDYDGLVVWQQRAVCRSFEVPAAWHWLSKASSVIIREWSKSQAGNTIITNLALANISVKAPVYAYVYLIRQAQRLKPYGVSPRIQRLLRLYLTHCATLWKEQGYTKVRIWLRESRYTSLLSSLLDYLDAEGFEQGWLDDKQATWTSLWRRSDDWHRRIAIAGMERELNGSGSVTWTSLVPETVIDGITFVPLNSSRALAIEGYEQHHCIGRYTDRCRRGSYRVYAVKDADGTRSTLGFEITSRKITMQQHTGKYNQLVSPAVRQASKQLIDRYQVLL